jgi:hypothetical protein
MRSIYFKAVLLIVLGFIFLAPRTSRADTLSISPASGSYSQGKTFSVKISVSSPTTAINAVSGTLAFPPDKLQVTSVSKAESILTLWVQGPSFSNPQGTVSFEGVVPNPGFTGSGGLVATVNFKVIGTGNAIIKFNNGSILANDGEGTNILKNLNTASYTLSTLSEPPVVLDSDKLEDSVITSSTHPDQNKWYSNNAPIFNWQVPAGATAVRLLYDHNPLSTPNKVYSPAISEKSLEDVPDGVYYFHAQFRTSAGWGTPHHFRFRIDTMDPDPFKIIFPKGNRSEIPDPAISFRASDSLSGIDHYDIKIGNGELVTHEADEALEPIKLPSQAAGTHTVLVRVVDKAGNSTTESADYIIESIKPPTITDYPKEIEEGDILKIAGKTYENSIVTLYLKDGHGVITSENTRSNGLGDFDTVWTKRINHGAFELSAIVTNPEGAKSSETEPLKIIVKQGAFIRFGLMTVNIISVILFFIVSLVGLVVCVWYVFSHMLKLKRKIRKDANLAEASLHVDFESLKSVIGKELERLERASLKRELTREEKSIMENITDYIDDIEKDLKHRMDEVKKDAS